MIIFTYCSHDSRTLGIGSKMSILADIVRVIESGKNSTELITTIFSTRSNILKTDVLGLILLGYQFGFLSGDDKNITVTKSGRHFMHYVEDTADKISQITNPADEKYSPLDNVLKQIEDKYQTSDSEIVSDLLKIRQAIYATIVFSPDLQIYSETLLTVSMPPSGVGQKIPSKLNHVIFHDVAIKNVIENATKEVLIATYTFDVPLFKTLLANINSKKLTCKIIVGDNSKLGTRDYTYGVEALKKFLDSHFTSYEIRLVKDTSKNYISHAKMWISEKAVLITSANIAFNSSIDNFEAGVYSTQDELIGSCSLVYNEIWNMGTVL